MFGLGAEGFVAGRWSFVCAGSGFVPGAVVSDGAVPGFGFGFDPVFGFSGWPVPGGFIGCGSPAREPGGVGVVGFGFGDGFGAPSGGVFGWPGGGLPGLAGLPEPAGGLGGLEGPALGFAAGFPGWADEPVSGLSVLGLVPGLPGFGAFGFGFVPAGLFEGFGDDGFVPVGLLFGSEAPGWPAWSLGAVGPPCSGFGTPGSPFGAGDDPGLPVFPRSVPGRGAPGSPGGLVSPGLALLEEGALGFGAFALSPFGPGFADFSEGLPAFELVGFRSPIEFPSPGLGASEPVGDGFGLAPGVESLGPPVLGLSEPGLPAPGSWALGSPGFFSGRWPAVLADAGPSRPEVLDDSPVLGSGVPDGLLFSPVLAVGLSAPWVEELSGSVPDFVDFELGSDGGEPGGWFGPGFDAFESALPVG